MIAGVAAAPGTSNAPCERCRREVGTYTPPDAGAADSAEQVAGFQLVRSILSAVKRCRRHRRPMWLVGTSRGSGVRQSPPGRARIAMASRSGSVEACPSKTNEALKRGPARSNAAYSGTISASAPALSCAGGA